jgi:hypothetical protein
MEYTPVILFAFNRPEGLKAIIESLLQNEEAKHSVLYVFVDGHVSNEKVKWKMWKKCVIM